MSENNADSMTRARALVETLADKGVLNWFYAPGSRDAPLGYVLEEMAEAGRVNLHVRIDERDTAFMALGSIRATGEPAAVVMTSGTAVGNALPAVMEAYHSHLPLLVLSADRPAELRGTGANQTTWQPGIFANFVGFEADLQPADGVDTLRAAVLQALKVAVNGQVEEDSLGASAKNEQSLIAPPHNQPGPVHLNLSFVEPLVPAEVDRAFTKKQIGLAPKIPASPDGLSFTGSVIIVGDHQGSIGWKTGERELWELAIDWKIPVLAEPTAGIWCQHPNTVRAASRIVGETALGSGVTGAAVIGRATLTRPISRLLKRLEAENSLVKLSEFRKEACGNKLVKNSADWLESWREEGERLAGELTCDWGIYQAAAAIAAADQGNDLFLGASLTIRAFDAVAAKMPAERRVFTNRGLSGIDGTIASAWGVALASGRPTRAVMGDVTFFHDMGALSCGSLEATPNLQVIVLDNGGGEIFAGLEHGQAAPTVRERMFLTPQRPDPAALATAAGWEVQTVRDREELLAALARPVKGLSLLRVVLPEPRDAPLY